MVPIDQKQCAGRRWRIFFALLCILLVVVAGTIQAAHTHADGTQNHADCPLCTTAHAAVHLVQMPAPVFVVTVVAVLEELPCSYARTALSTFALFTRPPPADTLPA